jgi:hypothetical protein
LGPSGGYSGLVHLYQSLGVINLLSSPMRTCHRPPNGICFRPNSSGVCICSCPTHTSGKSHTGSLLCWLDMSPPGVTIFQKGLALPV